MYEANYVLPGTYSISLTELYPLNCPDWHNLSHHSHLRWLHRLQGKIQPGIKCISVLCLCLISILIFILKFLVTSPPQNSQTASNHSHSTTRSSTMQLTKMIEMASSLRGEPLLVMIPRFRLQLQLNQSSNVNT